ncbi:hypothetical protein, partial [Pseudokineococcus marinus]
ARDPGLTWTTPLGQTVHVPAQPLLPRPAPRATDGVGAQTDAAAALEDHLFGGPRYPTRDSAAHDLDRVHAELARQHAEAQLQRHDALHDEGGDAGDGRPDGDPTPPADRAAGWGDDQPPPW